MSSDTYKAECLGCKKEFDYDPGICCTGYFIECGCMGRPTEPQVCSEECFNKVYPPYKEESDEN